MSQEILGTVFTPRKETLKNFIKRQEPNKEGVILVLGVETDFLKSIVDTIKKKTSRDVASGNFNNSFNINKWQDLLQKGTVVDGEKSKKVYAVVIVVSSSDHDIEAREMGAASNRVFDICASEMAAVLSLTFGDSVIIIRE